ncbi:hypothetical protein [Parazoarcus communis]|uniref:Uncharacterized protein n=1 Tax=Parazoarcus communis SWub3 = DSM 12120 TaxID=1121029 RepID=A0A323UNR6_9RHOO|nr:hypothetical protein [Parazoarcus communis]NMG72903.1 hypothetical protein [Parazoarcus communis SWub3 = DSM 12120]PZA14275.1 hypothetical protein DNK49_22745 [Azoarcus communis] [Parazoarcus communis SWub3 = DSM 12120]
MSEGHSLVEFDADALTFRLPSAQPFRVALSDVTRVYQVSAGWDVHANDQEFWVVDLPDRRVVLPDDAPGVYQAFTSARAQLASMGRLFSATCYMPPKAWRSKRLGLFPSYRVRAAVVPLQALTSIVPDWTAATISGETW